MSDNIPVDKFIPDVMKTYAENTESNVEIAIHAPKAHPGVPIHSQFIVINQDTKKAVSKFRMYHE